jgi:hypothetical protein
MAVERNSKKGILGVNNRKKVERADAVCYAYIYRR